MSKSDRANNEEKLIARWERKLERLGLGVLEPLCPSEQFTRLRPRALDKCKWYEMPDDAEPSAYRECIQKALKKLPYRERNIVMLHDGIGGDMHCYTFEEIGHIFFFF
jgi:DNA-directed RNA polymerase specialized sigma24 family protein